MASSSSTSRTRVLISGAGPTGLTLACVLARRGIAFRLLEMREAPHRHSRGKGMQPRTQEVMEDLGVLDSVVASGSLYPSFWVHLGPIGFPAGRISTIEAATAEVPYPNHWMVPQWRTEEILRERLGVLLGESAASKGVEFGVSLKGFEQSDSGVIATLGFADGREEEKVEADYIVGADGGRSVVRTVLGLDIHSEQTNPTRALLADIVIEGLDHTVWHAWPLATGGMVTLCPLPLPNTFQMNTMLWSKTPLPELNEAGIRAFLDTALGPGRFNVISVGWVSNFIPHAGMVDHFRVGRAFLAGDAAHIHPPSGGQGLNTGVQDAYNLGWKLASVLTGANESLLDTYELERLPIAASVLGLSKKLYGSAKRGEETKQLGLCYPDSPLSIDTRAKKEKLNAGDRAPDALCTNAAGKPRRLFEAFSGPHLSIIAFGDKGAQAARDLSTRYGNSLVRVIHVKRAAGSADEEEDSLIDLSGGCHSSYGAGPESIVLVRPDGYIGFMADQSSPALEDYLSRVLGAPPS